MNRTIELARLKWANECEYPDEFEGGFRAGLEAAKQVLRDVEAINKDADPFYSPFAAGYESATEEAMFRLEEFK
jgi:hypothetical protein